MGNGEITHVEDMPVFQVLYDLSLNVEKVSRDYGPDFRWLRVQLLKAIDRKIATRGKAKPRYGSVHEEPSIYSTNDQPNPEKSPSITHQTSTIPR